MSGLSERVQPEPLVGTHVQVPKRVGGDGAGRRAGHRGVVQLDEQGTTARPSSSWFVQHCVWRAVEHERGQFVGSVFFTAASSSSYDVWASSLNGVMRFAIRPAGSMTNKLRLSTPPRIEP